MELVEIGRNEGPHGSGVSLMLDEVSGLFAAVLSFAMDAEAMLRADIVRDGQ